MVRGRRGGLAHNLLEVAQTLSTPVSHSKMLCEIIVACHAMSDAQTAWALLWQASLPYLRPLWWLLS